MRLEEYGMTHAEEYAALIFCRVFPTPPPGTEKKDYEKAGLHVPVGYVFVIDPKYREKAKYKLPAGHASEQDRSQEDPPLATAVRELEGETGIGVPASAFRYAGTWLSSRGDHHKILFFTSITEADRDWMNDHHHENEGEVPTFLTVERFYELVREDKFMREHYEKLVEFALVLPFGRDKPVA